MSELSRALSAMLSAVVVLAVTAFPIAGASLWGARWWLDREAHQLDLTATDYYLAGIVLCFTVMMGYLLAGKTILVLHAWLELLPADEAEDKPGGGGGTPVAQSG